VSLSPFVKGGIVEVINGIFTIIVVMSNQALTAS
jgi:hypothetical protein